MAEDEEDLMQGSEEEQTKRRYSLFKWTSACKCKAPVRCRTTWSKLRPIRQEAVAILRLAWPIAISYILKQVLFIVSLSFCGHIDATSSITLDAAGLALSLINITGFSIAVGLGAAMDTLASQAWGAKSYLKVGIYLQRGICVFALAMIPVYALWLNIETVLNLLQQPPCVVEKARDYIHVFASCLPVLFLNVLLERYLQVQNILYPLIVTGVIANVVNVAAHALFVLVAQWGIIGAAAATSLAMYTMTISLLAIIFARKLHKKTWGGWSREALKDWGQFARYGIPGLVMLSVEWWSFELGYVALGLLRDGVVQQGMQAVLINYGTFAFMVPASLGIAATVRVGNELGAGRPKEAKRSFLLCLAFLGCWLLFLEVFTVSLWKQIATVFTSDACLLNAIAIPFYFFLINLAGDHAQGFLSGVLRGSGKQLLGSVSNIFSYGIGITVGCVLVFVVELGVTGYWLGMTIAVTIQASTYLTVLFCMNWKKQSEKAQRNAQLNLASDTANASDGAVSNVDTASGVTVEMTTYNFSPSDSEANTEELPNGSDIHRRGLSYQIRGVSEGQEQVKLVAMTTLDDGLNCSISSLDNGNQIGSDSTLFGLKDDPPNEKVSDDQTVQNLHLKPELDVDSRKESDSGITVDLDRCGEFTMEQSDFPATNDQTPLVSVPEEGDEFEENGPSQNGKIQPSPAVHLQSNPSTVGLCCSLSARVVFSRLLLLFSMLGLFAACLVLSQVFVYNPNPCNSNTTATLLDVGNGSRNVSEVPACIVYSVL